MEPIIPVENLREGYESAIDNARRLLNDAQLLYTDGCFASSIQLSILSCEEAGKAYAILNYLSQGKNISKNEWIAKKGLFRSHWKKLFLAQEAGYLSLEKKLKEAVQKDPSLARFLGIKPHETTVMWTAGKLKECMTYLEYDFKNNKWLKPNTHGLAIASVANGQISMAKSIIKAVQEGDIS